MSARRGATATWAPISSHTASSALSDQLMSHASPPGPCSACRITSTAARIGRRRLVDDHHHLGRAGERRRHAHEPGHLALGDGDVDVARADDHVDRRHRLGAVGHGADGLGAADGVHLVDPGDGGGRQGGRRHGSGPGPVARTGPPGPRRPPGPGWRSSAPCWDRSPDHRARSSRHGRRGPCGPRPRCRRARSGGRPPPAARGSAGCRRPPPRARCAARVDRRQGGGEVGGRHPQGLGSDAVEALGEVSHGLVAALAHLGEDGLDRGHGLVGGLVGPGQAASQVVAFTSEVESSQHEGRGYRSPPAARTRFSGRSAAPVPAIRRRRAPSRPAPGRGWPW